MSTTNISILPRELFSQIFSLLPPKDLKSASLVCKLWKEMAGEPKLWTWAVVTINNRGDLKKKFKVPRLGQIKTIRFNFKRQPKPLEHLEKLLQALLAFPTIKKIYGMNNWDFRSVEPSVVVAVVLGRIDELDTSYGLLSKSQLDHVYSVISKKEQPMKKLSLYVWGVDGLNPDVVASAATNVKELELGCWCDEDQVKALLMKIVEKDGPMAKLKIHGNSLLNLDPDLVASALNRLEEVEVMYSRLSQDQITAVLKGVVEGGSKLKKLWLHKVGPRQSLDRELVRQAEQKIGKFCK